MVRSPCRLSPVSGRPAPPKAGEPWHELNTVKEKIRELYEEVALFGLLPRFKTLAFDRKYLPLGGLLSGFFGGLSGLQGAMRSAFLIKAGLNKEAFIGTNTVSAVVVDVARLIVYGLSFFRWFWFHLENSRTWVRFNQIWGALFPFLVQGNASHRIFRDPRIMIDGLARPA
jgi:hypothetical protein